MRRLRSLAAGALAAAALAMLPGADSRADFSIRLHSGFGSSHYGPGRHDRPFNHHRPRAHGFKHHRHRHHGHRHHGHRPRHHGVPGRHVLGSGCSAVTRRSYDRHGRLVLNHATVCFDRFGRAYFLEPHRRRH